MTGYRRGDALIRASGDWGNLYEVLDRQSHTRGWVVHATGRPERAFLNRVNADAAVLDAKHAEEQAVKAALAKFHADQARRAAKPATMRAQGKRLLAAGVPGGRPASTKPARLGDLLLAGTRGPSPEGGKVVGIFRQPGGTGYDALTYTRSRTFKTAQGAARWMKRMRPDDKRVIDQWLRRPGEPAPAPAPQTRPFRPGDVVTVDGRTKRYLIVGVMGSGKADLQALSGAYKGSEWPGVEPERLRLSDDQTIQFAGAIADTLESHAKTRLQYRANVELESLPNYAGVAERPPTRAQEISRMLAEEKAAREAGIARRKAAEREARKKREPGSIRTYLVPAAKELSKLTKKLGTAIARYLEREPDPDDARRSTKRALQVKIATIGGAAQKLHIPTEGYLGASVQPRYAMTPAEPKRLEEDGLYQDALASILQTQDWLRRFGNEAAMVYRDDGGERLRQVLSGIRSSWPSVKVDEWKTEQYAKLQEIGDDSLDSLRKIRSVVARKVAELENQGAPW